MSGSRRVLVTSATGRIGKELIARLSKNSNFILRAGLRDTEGEGAQQLKALGCQEVMKFDYTDPSTWEQSCTDVNVVYSASLDPLLEHHLKFCDYLGTLYGGGNSKLDHVVRISCMGADTNTACYDKNKHVTRDGAEIPLMLQHYWWGEERLVTNKLPATVLRNNFFMNHLLKTDIENISQEGTGFFSNPLGKSRNSFVSTSDIAEAAAVVIADGPAKHSNKFYDITGPEPQSMDEIAADLSTAMGKKIEYRAQDMVQFEKDFGATRAGFFEYLCNGFYTRCSPDFYNIVGRRPTRYIEYLQNKGAAGQTGLEELYVGNLWKKGVDAMKDAAGPKA